MPFIRQSFHIHTPIKATQFLIRTLGYAPNIAQKIIDKARLRDANNTPVSKSQLLHGQIWLTHFVDDFYPQDELIAPLFETPDFAIFNKPAKLLTHPKGSFLHKSLIDSARFFCGKQAQAIHRLDYETSGLILIAKNRTNEITLKQLITNRHITKIYIAKVNGIVKKPICIHAPIITPKRTQRPHANLSIRSRIDTTVDSTTPMPHKPHSTLLESILTHKPHQATSTPSKHALTIIVPLESSLHEHCTYILARPLTGRTHQIRVHCAYKGFPICNDFLYGSDDEQAAMYLDYVRIHGANPTQHTNTPFQNTLCLHAYHLRFTHKGTIFSLYAPLPEWFSKNITSLALHNALLSVL